jgi:hypothetical protein
METVFSRLRRLEASKDRSLHEMIVDACDAGDFLVSGMHKIAQNSADDYDTRIAYEAIERAYVSNGNTPDNGARAA